MNFLRLFLALPLLPTGPASGFDLFAKKKRSAAEHLKVLYSSASMEIAAGRNPSGNR